MSDAAFFVSGGTLPLSAGSYVERAADRALYDALAQGCYAYVLNARQMGKSSLCVRTIARLEGRGVRTAFVDLTRVGGRNLTADQWYLGLLNEIARGIGGRAEMVRFWKESPDLGPMQRFFGALAAYALPEGTPPLVVFVDEVDATRSLPFSADEFFGGVRECFNRRAHDPAFERLTFCLLGAAIPSDLIRDMEASPFNVGERVAVKDFTKEEARAFAPHLGPNGRALVTRVVHWTNGHPFLTQSLCARLAEASAKTSADVDRLVEADLFAPSARESNVNLADVGNRVLLSSDGADPDRHRAEVLALYDRVRKGKRVEDDESNPRVAILKLAGLVVAEGGLLRVRNRIYARVFGPAWIQEHTPDGEARRVRRAYRVGLLRAAAAGAALLAIVGTLGASAAGNARRAETNALKAENALAEARRDRDRALNAEARATTAAKQANDERNRALTLSAERTRALGLAKRGQDAALLARNDARASARRATRSAADAREEAAQAVQAKNAADAASGREAAQRRLAVAARGVADARLRTALLGEARDRMQQGDDAGALRPLVAGLRLLAPGSPAADAQRRRIGFALASSSGLRQVWPTKGAATASAFSPDGRLAAVGDASGEVRLWNVATGEPASPPLRHPGPVRAIVFSHEGRRLATAGGDAVALWDATDGRPLAPPSRQGARVNVLAFSPDDRTLASGEGAGELGQMGGVAFLDGVTGVLRAWWPFMQEAEVGRLAYRPDGRRLVAGSRNYISTLIELDPKSGMPTASGSAGRSYNTYAVGFSPDGRWFALAGTFDSYGRVGNAALCDAATGAEVVRYHDPRADARTRGFQSAGTALGFTPRGDAVLVANASGVARLWGTLDSVPQGPPLRHDSPLVAAVLSPDGTRAATACLDGSIRVWDPRTGETIGSPFWHGGPVTGLAFDPSGTRLLTSSEDGTARVWEVGVADHGARRLALVGPHPEMEGFLAQDGRPGVVPLTYRVDGGLVRASMDGKTMRVAPVGDGSWLAAGSLRVAERRIALQKGDRLQVWDLAANRPITPEIPVRSEGPLRADLDPTERFLVAEESPGILTARRADAAAAVLGRLAVPRKARFAISAGGETVAYQAAGEGALWRPSDGRILRRWGTEASGLDFVLGGRRLAQLALDTKGRRVGLRFIDASTGVASKPSLLPTESLEDPWAATTDRVGFVFYGARDRRWVARWDLATERFLGRNRGSARRNYATIDRDFLITTDASYDARDGRFLFHFPPFSQNNQWSVFAPDGATFAAEDPLNQVRIWEARTGRLRVGPMPLTAPANHMAFSEDGSLLAVGCVNGDLRVFDARTGDPITPTLRHSGSVVGLRFVRDDRALLVAADGLSLLPLARDERPVADLARLADLVSTAAGEARGNAAGWTALRRSYPAEFAFREASPEPVPPPARDEEAALDGAVRETKLGLGGADAWFDYALASARVGRWEEGLGAIDRAEKAGRTGVASDYLRGTFQARTGRYREALATFEAARQVHPGDLFTGCIADTDLRAGDYGAFASVSEVRLNAMRNVSQETLARERSRAALAYGLAGRPGEARRLLAPVVAQALPGMDPDDAGALAREVSVMPDALADYAPVVRAVEPVLRAKPDSATLNTLALLLLRVGRDADAIRTIEEGVRLNGGKPDPSDEFVLGAASRELGRLAAAREHLRASVDGFEAKAAALAADAPDRLEIETLLREARELLKALAPDSSPPKG